jgi:hypothetical protein
MAVTRKSRTSAADPDQWRLAPGLQAKLTPPSAAACQNPLCGTLAAASRSGGARLTGMVRTGVYGSAEPDRIWCGGLCAAYGMALAEVRVRVRQPVTP